MEDKKPEESSEVKDVEEVKKEEKVEEKADKQETGSEEKKVDEIKPIVHHIHTPTHSNKESLTNKMKKNPWIVSTLVFAILALILITGVFSNGGITGNVISGEVISAEIAGNKVLELANSQVPEGAELIEVNEVSGLYEVVLLIEGRELPVYLTADGKNLVSDLAPIDLILEQAGQQAPPSAQIAVDVSEDDDAVKGDADAPITIIEFSDYECPYCGKYFRETLPQLISEYVDTGKVKLVFRDFPLGFHEKAQKAGEAAECAGEQGKYWEMHDKLFENQGALDVDSLKSYAKNIGLNTGDFDACLDSGEMADEVAADMQDGSLAGVSGTPAFFINGKLVSGALPFEQFKQIIDAELASLESVESV